MLNKIGYLNQPYQGGASEESLALHRDGSLLKRAVFTPEEIGMLRDEILNVFATVPPDMRDGRTSIENAEMFRYEMFNRSALSQKAIAKEEILSVIEPLLGQDCHLINCTAWKNHPGNEHAPNGQEWHIDGGPHVPRAPGIDWPENIHYPVFVIATHIFLEDVGLNDGPTIVAPGSHTSGRVPPPESIWDLTLSFKGRSEITWTAKAGDVGFFISDVWHRRLPPSPEGTGRFFLQSNYGRREIAQRIRPTDITNHATKQAIARAETERERQLIGLHRQVFYDG
jgi:hypothetical protein